MVCCKDSLLGNYSSSSPEEKRIKEAERNRKYQEHQEIIEQSAQEYYEKVLYQSKIRKIILERDNFTCQICNKIGDTKLHIHHICKKNKERNDCLDNLITLCPKCHNNADRSEYNPIWQK